MPLSPDSQLPIVDGPAPAVRRPAGPLRGIAMHVLRVSLFIAILALVHDQQRAARTASSGGVIIALANVQTLFPAATSVEPAPHARFDAAVLDHEGTVLGYVLQTSPGSDRIIGYSGATNTLIGIDPQGRISGLAILRSGDTADHVRTVEQDGQFLRSLDGLEWEQAAIAPMDAVSGATLTSLAISEGVQRRLGGTRPSLRFPQDLSVDEVKPFLEAAVRLESRASAATAYDVLDANDERIGAVLRTSPATDNIMGYQGPTDAILVLDTDKQVVGLSVHASYDNEPYVGYVRDDYWFRAMLNGQTLEHLADYDPVAAEVEGVSGATMTSMAVARGISAAAQSALLPPPEPPARRTAFSSRDAGTLAVLAAALVMSFTRLRGARWARVGFQLLLIGYLGFLNGDLLSQALLVGWAQNGVPWRLAPGLTILTAAALVVPIVSKRQLYCHHVCPYGAAQQLIRNRLPWRVNLPPRLAAGLAVIPSVLLLLVLLVALLGWPVNLASIEPFDAFVFWVAGAATVAIAIVGLIAASLVPMAYCRFGCPTGAVLSYLRFHSHGDRFTRRDLAAVGLLAVAVVLRFF